MPPNDPPDQAPPVFSPASPPAANNGGVWPPSPTNSPGYALNQNARPNFIPGGGLARAIVALLGVGIAVDALSLPTEIAKSPAGQIVNGILALLYLLVFLGTGICFLIWTNRAYKNLQAFGAQGLSSTPGWAVGYFFIPFLNLYKPYNIFSELWRASDPAVDSSNLLQWKAVKVPALLGVWWLLWIISNVLGRLAFSQSMNAANAQGSVVDTAGLSIANDVVNIVAAICAILVVRGLTARQDAKWEAMRRSPAQAPLR